MKVINVVNVFEMHVYMHKTMTPTNQALLYLFSEYIYIWCAHIKTNSMC